MRGRLTVTAALIGTMFAPASATADVSAAFYTPSRNIACSYYRGSTDEELLCEARWNLAHQWKINNGRAFKRVSRSTVKGPFFVLRYGRSMRRGQILCTSRRAGLTCRHTGTGHGFFLSRQRQRVF